MSKKTKVVPMNPQPEAAEMAVPEVVNPIRDYKEGETIQIEAVGLVAIFEALSELADENTLTLFPAKENLEELMKSKPVTHFTDKGVRYASLASFAYQTLHFAKMAQQSADKKEEDGK